MTGHSAGYRMDGVFYIYTPAVKKFFKFMAGVLRLRMRLGSQSAVYYRRREHNTDRKAGNIADWVRTWGGAYESMVILDADSLMGAV